MERAGWVMVCVGMVVTCGGVEMGNASNPPMRVLIACRSIVRSPDSGDRDGVPLIASRDLKGLVSHSLMFFLGVKGWSMCFMPSVMTDLSSSFELSDESEDGGTAIFLRFFLC